MFRERTQQAADPLVWELPSHDIYGKQLAAAVNGAIGEAGVTIDDLFGEGDRVAARFTLSGIHGGNTAAQPAPPVLQLSRTAATPASSTAHPSRARS
jgi:hypothetical protein